jgi:hypothetical protein
LRFLRISLYLNVITTIIAQQAHCFCGDMNSRESIPGGFLAGFMVAHATEESAKARDQPQHLVAEKPTTSVIRCTVVHFSKTGRGNRYYVIGEVSHAMAASGLKYLSIGIDPRNRHEPCSALASGGGSVFESP